MNHMCSNTCCMAQPSPAIAICLMPQGSGREKTQCPVWKAFYSKQQRLKGLLWARAAGWSLSCCRASAAIRHWTGCRMGKGRERCFVPMIGGFLAQKTLGFRSHADTDCVQVSGDVCSPLWPVLNTGTPKVLRAIPWLSSAGGAALTWHQDNEELRLRFQEAVEIPDSCWDIFHIIEHLEKAEMLTDYSVIPVIITTGTTPKRKQTGAILAEKQGQWGTLGRCGQWAHTAGSGLSCPACSLALPGPSSCSFINLR